MRLFVVRAGCQLFDDVPQLSLSQHHAMVAHAAEEHYRLQGLIKRKVKPGRALLRRAFAEPECMPSLPFACVQLFADAKAVFGEISKKIGAQGLHPLLVVDAGWDSPVVVRRRDVRGGVGSRDRGGPEASRDGAASAPYSPGGKGVSLQQLGQRMLCCPLQIMLKLETQQAAIVQLSESIEKAVRARPLPAGSVAGASTLHVTSAGGGGVSRDRSSAGGRSSLAHQSVTSMAAFAGSSPGQKHHSPLLGAAGGASSSVLMRGATIRASAAAAAVSVIGTVGTAGSGTPPRRSSIDAGAGLGSGLGLGADDVTTAGAGSRAGSRNAGGGSASQTAAHEGDRSESPAVGADLEDELAAEAGLERKGDFGASNLPTGACCAPVRCVSAAAC